MSFGPDNGDRAGFAEEAVEAFLRVCRGDREDAIGDLICNLMHLADADGDDPLVLVKRAIVHHYAETHHERLCQVEITVMPEQKRKRA